MLAMAGETVVAATGGTSGGTVHTITTSPLTIGSGTPYVGGLNWSASRVAPLNIDGRAIVGASTEVATITSDGHLNVIASPALLAGLSYVDGTVYVSGAGGATVFGDFTEVVSLNIDTGSISSVAVGPEVDTWWSPMAATPTADGGWAFPNMIRDPLAWRSNLVVQDSAGAVITDTAWPIEQRSVYGETGVAYTTDGRTVLAIPHGTTTRDTPGGYFAGRVTFAVVDRSGTVEVLEAMDDIPYFDTIFFSFGPVVATGGSTAVIAATFLRGEDDQDVELTAWTLDLPGGGLLTIDTLDHEWWTVGTRDPNMAYELLVSTPLGWKVEIVAGEEHLATDELCVYDPMHEEAGEDGWVVCALFRPE